MATIPLDIQITDEDLPVLSVVATQALNLLEDPNATNRQIEELIRQDPALTQRVLHISNSPYYAGRIPSQSIAAAVSRLGLRQLRNVIIAAATGDLFDAADQVVARLWDHAVAVAIGAAQLAAAVGGETGEEAFIAGMLHDVGKMIIYRQHPEIYAQLLEEAHLGRRRTCEIESERFAYFTHMSIGGLVARKWMLSDVVAEAARFHHDAETEVHENLKNPRMTCIVSAANLLASQLGYGSPAEDWPPLQSRACARRLNLTGPMADKIGRQVQELFAAQRAALG